ncbi:uncharacterized protein LOC131997953 [Stomoxys calcitrans]|uniref:uncharacterized protein LOC131997953 n=1 Tax=Stomoxys calcitrans TaxID=35570 RepID=UPI0027E37CA8|nr:uncharacterized protein LOC131997953 [Stomoxys calcitrans]
MIRPSVVPAQSDRPVQIAANLIIVESGQYIFEHYNEEIFEKCPNIPGNNGIHDFFSVDQMTHVLDEGLITARGNSTCVWKGVEPTDRIEITVEVYIFKRGTWQVSPFTLYDRDWCKSLFDKTSFWYKIWTKNIRESDRKCVNIYGHTFRYDEFTVDTVLEFPTNVGGRYKGVTTIVAIDKQGTAEHAWVGCMLLLVVVVCPLVWLLDMRS